MKLPRVPDRTTTGFAFSIVGRALHEGLADRKFGRLEIDAVLAYFGDDAPNCAFCGSEDVKRWDHLVPISQGGDTVLGNMVPACAQCDDSKQHLPYAEWMRSPARYSPFTRGVLDLEKRLHALEVYTRQHGYRPRAAENRLGPEELAEWHAIQEDLARVRKRVESFLLRHHTENGAT